MPSRPAKKFRFDPQASIGAVDATNDQFLAQCFVDKGDVQALLDFGDHRCIVVGRTGAGKSALIERIRNTDHSHSIEIDPQNLALSYILSSPIKYLEEIGVSLRPFYKLLWKHVFVTEIIKKHFNLQSQVDRDSFMNRLDGIIRRDRAKAEAIQYYREWGDKFWETTETRVKEIVAKVTRDVERSITGSAAVTSIPLLNTGFEAAKKSLEQVSEEQRKEVISRIQTVISEIQLNKLNKVIELLATDLLTDNQRYYYLTIDDLDNSWVEGELRYKLIFELLTAAKEINSSLPGSVKIIVALREDLLHSVYETLRSSDHSGFQQEKYEDLYFRISWSASQLKDLLNKRIENLYDRQYTSQPVTLDEVFPSSVTIPDSSLGKSRKVASMHYLLSRTMMVPRDVIRFANICISTAKRQDLGAISKSILLSAEQEYSEKRLLALYDEWGVIYPNLNIACEIIRGYPASIRADKVDLSQFQSRVVRVFGDIREDKNCPVYLLLLSVFETQNGISVEEAFRRIMHVLFHVGLIGLQRSNSETIQFSIFQRNVSTSDFSDGNTIHIHPAFLKALNIRLEG